MKTLLLLAALLTAQLCIRLHMFVSCHADAGDTLYNSELDSKHRVEGRAVPNVGNNGERTAPLIAGLDLRQVRVFTNGTGRLLK